MTRESIEQRGTSPGEIVSRDTIEQGREASRAQAVAFTWLQLAEITEIEKADDGKWNGLLTVNLLTIAGNRQRVKMTLGAVGNGIFVGGPPEPRTLVVVGWLPAGMPVLLAQVPMTIEGLRVSKSLPDLIEGEYLLRAGVLAQSDSEKIPGGSVFLDRNGRVILENQNKTAEVVIGEGLVGATDGEPTKNPAETGNDPKTSKPTLVRVRTKDSDGNTLATLYMDTEGNVTLEAETLRLAVNDMAVGEGTNDRDQLVTRGWVVDTYMLHSHAAQGASPPTTPGSAFTSIQKSK